MAAQQKSSSSSEDGKNNRARIPTPLATTTLGRDNETLLSKLSGMVVRNELGMLMTFAPGQTGYVALDSELNRVLAPVLERSTTLFPRLKEKEIEVTKLRKERDEARSDVDRLRKERDSYREAAGKGGGAILNNTILKEDVSELKSAMHTHITNLKRSREIEDIMEKTKSALTEMIKAQKKTFKDGESLNTSLCSIADRHKREEARLAEEQGRPAAAPTTVVIDPP